MRKLLVQANHFVRTAARESGQAAEGRRFLEMLKDFRRWQKSLGQSPMDQHLPWMSYGAIDFLKATIRRDWKAFEWGVGGSTGFLASRVGCLVSVEHNAEWADKVRLAMESVAHKQWKLFTVPPQARPGDAGRNPSDPLDYASAFEPYCGNSFKDYASIIDQYGDQEFDLVIVDGRCRPSCAMHAMKKIKRGGYLIFDDCERPRYAWIHEETKRRNWQYRYFNGSGPGTWDFRHTGCWQKTS